MVARCKVFKERILLAQYPCDRFYACTDLGMSIIYEFGGHVLETVFVMSALGEAASHRVSK
jgi:hypothetical protein